MEKDRFDLIDQEQLAAQVIAIMDGHLVALPPTRRGEF
jgi:hypothetical protein